MTAAEAAALIGPDCCVGFSGFTLVGNPSQVPGEIAKLGRARNMTVLTGASVSDSLDGALARAGLMAFRTPYQSNKSVREGINGGNIGYNDFHLSHLPSAINRGTGPHIDWAVVECAAIVDEGLVPFASVGATDCFVRNADRVIVELNEDIPDSMYGMHDIYTQGWDAIPITGPSDRAGTPYIPCALEKVAAVVLTRGSAEYPSFKEPDDVSLAMSENILRLLRQEVEAGRQPKNLNPIQSGVGSVANAVLSGLGKGFTGLRMFTEVMQDSAFELVRDGIITAASTTALSFSKQSEEELYSNIGFYKSKIVLRPQEISNNPELIRRMQLVSMNTPIEVDIYGNVNSTHIMGTRVMNGIGGSGDFARNAGLTIFATGSLAKGGKISCIVPMVSHVDHTEHDVDVIVTEQGIADLRWKSPRQRAESIIENCVHPDYKPMLREYFEEACRCAGGHTPHILSKAFDWHERYLNSGSMLPTGR